MSNFFRPNGLYTFRNIIPMGAELIVYCFGCGFTRALLEIIAFGCRAFLCGNGTHKTKCYVLFT